MDSSLFHFSFGHFLLYCILDRRNDEKTLNIFRNAYFYVVQHICSNKVSFGEFINSLLLKKKQTWIFNFCKSVVWNFILDFLVMTFSRHESFLLCYPQIANPRPSGIYSYMNRYMIANWIFIMWSTISKLLYIHMKGLEAWLMFIKYQCADNSCIFV